MAKKKPIKRKAQKNKNTDKKEAIDKKTGKKKGIYQKRAEKVSPKVREQLDLFLINGMNIIYEQEMTESILAKVKSYPDPLKAIAELTIELVQRLKESAVKNGQELVDDVLVHGGNVLMGEIMRVLEAAGMKPLSEKQKVSCWQLAISMYLDSGVKSGELSKEKLIADAKKARKTKRGQRILKTAQKPEMRQTNQGQPNQARPVQTRPTNTSPAQTRGGKLNG